MEREREIDNGEREIGLAQYGFNQSITNELLIGQRVELAATHRHADTYRHGPMHTGRHNYIVNPLLVHLCAIRGRACKSASKSTDIGTRIHTIFVYVGLDWRDI